MGRQDWDILAPVAKGGQYERDDISPSNIVLLMQLDESFNVTADAFFYSSSLR